MLMIVLYKHALWSDSFHNEQLMVLPYLKGSLYILVLSIVWMHIGYFQVKGLSFIFYPLRFTISGIGVLSWARKSRKDMVLGRSEPQGSLLFGA
jgi:hypothetical protein